MDDAGNFAALTDNDHNTLDPSATARLAEADVTVVHNPAAKSDRSGALQAVKVSWLVDGERQTMEFDTSFNIGRSTDCKIRFKEDDVSRTHTRIYILSGQWHVADLESGNGTFLDGLRVHDAVLPHLSTLQLGPDGPRLWIETEGAEASPSMGDIAERYFGSDADDEVGHKTLMFRRAYRRVATVQKRKYRGIIASAIGLLMLSVAVGVYQQLALQKTRAMAVEMFYSMKAVQVQISEVENQVRSSGNAAEIANVNARRAQAQLMETRYDGLVNELGILGPDISEQDRIILRVARMFGECELNIPDGFVTEVKNYIGKWQSTNRLSSALARMNEQNLAAKISATMLENHLPPQFLYVALQESEFDSRAVGPKTRFGIAKGIWQFIPATARRYGLRTGPLVELRRHDPRDQRFDTDRATDAAARYLRDIYSKDSQASGLLTIAAYNWGPNNILKRIKDMPDNPRDRNFWRLMNEHQIPQETYDYVFYIVSAIVIGENPALFGFDFENPLKDIELGAIEL